MGWAERLKGKVERQAYFMIFEDENGNGQVLTTEENPVKLARVLSQVLVDLLRAQESGGGLQPQEESRLVRI
jgi:hypothetical protein